MTRLYVEWIISFEEDNEDKGKKILPAKMEADLIQAFYDDARDLPAFNTILLAITTTIIQT